MPEQIQSASMTSEWEEKLLRVERGEYEEQEFMQEISAMIDHLVKNYEAVKDANVLMPEQQKAFGKCPACGSDVAERQKGYFCTNKNCKFALWKNNRYFECQGKKMTSQLAKALLSDGRAKLKGCKSAKTGRTYDATVVMNTDSTGQVQYSMEFGGSKK